MMHGASQTAMGTAAYEWGLRITMQDDCNAHLFLEAAGVLCRPAAGRVAQVPDCTRHVSNASPLRRPSLSRPSGTPRRTLCSPLVLRSRIALTCADGKSNLPVAAAFRVVKQAMGKWRARFTARRLDGLLDEHRPGVPRRSAMPRWSEW